MRSASSSTEMPFSSSIHSSVLVAITGPPCHRRRKAPPAPRSTVCVSSAAVRRLASGGRLLAGRLLATAHPPQAPRPVLAARILPAGSSAAARQPPHRQRPRAVPGASAASPRPRRPPGRGAIVSRRRLPPPAAAASDAGRLLRRGSGVAPARRLLRRKLPDPSVREHPARPDSQSADQCVQRSRETRDRAGDQPHELAVEDVARGQARDRGDVGGAQRGAVHHPALEGQQLGRAREVRDAPWPPRRRRRARTSARSGPQQRQQLVGSGLCRRRARSASS